MRILPYVKSPSDQLLWLGLGHYGAIQAYLYLRPFSEMGAVIFAFFLAQLSGTVVAYLSEEA